MIINGEKVLIVVPWHNEEQLHLFCDAWHVKPSDKRFVFQQDKDRQGCARTKNHGINEAMFRGADVVIVLDDDCYPAIGIEVESFISAHLVSLNPKRVEMFKAVTAPQSRGTPYLSRDIEYPVAASMGFWIGIGDYDAPSQLVHRDAQMEFDHRPIYGQYFPLCGMNLAFRPKDWEPWFRFIDVPRFDDIWSGWLWQKEAYRRGYCFSLNGPTVRHARQSNVWTNLRDEVKHLEANETLWRKIAMARETDYNSLRTLLPV